MMNLMTVDVEDYFQVSGFEDRVPRSSWSSYESRVVPNTERLLDIFDEANVRGTFFVLGWVAERFPALVRRIHDAGHELASHGYAHQLVYSLTPDEFRADVRRARDVIEAASGVRVVGYRAPSFSITDASLWALDVLVEEGYTYDASVYPIRHDRYGIPTWPRQPRLIERAAGTIWELPGSTVTYANANLPFGGGGYFRLLPYWWTARGMNRLNRQEQRPAMFYLHPWEVDPGQPRIQTSRLTQLRHYANLGKTEQRLRRLLGDFQFGPVRDLLVASAGNGSAQPR
jgi:polysaccharide deacetylase family protein (PEP-CTERM system associated)